MGEPMAGRLLDVFDVAVWNRSPDKANTLIQQGARRSSTPAAAAFGADVLITMLATPEAVEQVLLGEQGAARALPEGAAVVEMSTIGPAAIAQLRTQLPAHLRLVDAPVLGSVKQAVAGELKVFAGGDGADIDRIRPVLDRLGTVRHLGPLGSGAAMKLVANACLGILMTGLGEALTLADGLGLPQDDVLDVLSDSPIGVTTKSKRPNIESDTWPPNFKLSLAAKDLRLVLDAAAAAGLDVRLLHQAKDWFDAANTPERAALDYSVVIDTIRRSSGSS